MSDFDLIADAVEHSLREAGREDLVPDVLWSIRDRAQGMRVYVPSNKPSHAAIVATFDGDAERTARRLGVHASTVRRHVNRR